MRARGPESTGKVRAGICIAGLAGVGLLLFGGLTAAQDISAMPRYGETNLESGFRPDPYSVTITAGGPDSAEHLGDECVGFISNASPDYAVDYQPGQYRLGFFVTGSIDSTLVVRDPAGTWHCNDDFDHASGRNPGIIINGPDEGRYNIWVGVYEGSDTGEDVRLDVSEGAPPWASDDQVAIDYGDNAGTYANDGECDDPRFTGPGLAAQTSEMHRFHDADDCRTLLEEGQVALLPPDEQPPPAEPGTTLTSSGSGFFVADSGHVLTNHHVIDGCTRTSIRVMGEPPVDAVVVAANADVDLALLKAPTPPPATAPFRAGRSIRQGEEVVVFGFPLYGELSSQGNLTDGLVSALSGFGDDLRVIQVSAPVQPGNSGGPVMDRSGSIVGVIVSGADSTAFLAEGRSLPQNVNFAVRMSIAQSFLDTNNVDYAVTSSDEALSIADIGERAQEFTALILCYE